MSPEPSRLFRPRYLRSTLWLMPGLAATLLFVLLGGGDVACDEAACQIQNLGSNAGLFGIAASLAAFGVEFASDHVFGRYARDLARWKSGLPPA